MSMISQALNIKIHQWAKDHPELAETIAKLLLQKRREDGLARVRKWAKKNK